MNALVLWLKGIQLRLMLWILGWMLHSKSKKSQEFKALLAEKDVVLQFGTMDDKVTRHYIVKNDSISSVGGAHPEATMVLNFTDAPYAVGTLMKQDQMAFMAGVQEQKITVAGDVSLLMWFMTLVKQIRD